GLTAGLLLRREEIVEFVGLGERELGEEGRVLVDVIAEAAERRGIAGVAVERFRRDSSPIAAACDSVLARGDGAQIGRGGHAGLAELVTVDRAGVAGNEAAEGRDRLAAVENIGHRVVWGIAGIIARKLRCGFRAGRLQHAVAMTIFDRALD